MEQHSSIIPVRAVLNGKCKRFGIFADSSFSNFKDLLVSNFACEVQTIRYKDVNELPVQIHTEAEFKAALKAVPKTGGILRLVLSSEQEVEEPQIPAYFLDNLTECLGTNKSVAEEIAEAHRRSTEMLMTWDYEVTPKVQEGIELDWMDNNRDAEWSPPLCEFTGCILSPTSVTGLNNNTWAGQQRHGAGKVRRVWSGTAPLCAVRTDDELENVRGRPVNGATEKRKHSDSSTSMYRNPRSRSVSSESSSSSGSGSDSEEDIALKCSKKKRKLSPTVNMEHILHQWEKQIANKVTKDMKKRSKKFKNDIVETVTTTILQKLDGASTSKGEETATAVASQTVDVDIPTASPDSSLTTTTLPTDSRTKFHHENVICDNCEAEIFGPRYKCGNCVDYDLCERCEAIEGVHVASHVFLKMHYPTPMLSCRRYTGGTAQPLLHSNVYVDSEAEREKKEDKKKEVIAVQTESVIGKCEKRRTRLREEEEARKQREEEESEDSDQEEEKVVKKVMKIVSKGDVVEKATSDIWKEEWEKMREDMQSERGYLSDTQIEKFRFEDDFVAKEAKKVRKVSLEEKHVDHVPQQVSTDELEAKIKTLDEQLASALSALQLLKDEIPFYLGDKDESDVEEEEEDEEECGLDQTSMDFLADFADLFDTEDVVVVCEGSKQPSPQTTKLLARQDKGEFFCNGNFNFPSQPDDFVFVADFFDLVERIDNEKLRTPFGVSDDDLTIEFAEPDMTSSMIESTTETISPEDEEEDLLTVSQLGFGDDDLVEAEYDDADEELLTVSQLGACSSSATPEEDLLTMSTVSITENDDDDFLLVSSESMAETTASWKKKKNKKKQKLMYDSFNDFEFYN